MYVTPTYIVVLQFFCRFPKWENDEGNHSKAHHNYVAKKKSDKEKILKVIAKKRPTTYRETKIRKQQTPH